jgi:hypothetical protein
MLEKEFKYYVNHQAELVKKFLGRFLLIKDETVVKDFGTIEDAFSYASKIYEPGTFLIQECLPGEDNYTQTFLTRAIFV